jgi:hypothetical protein
MKRPLADVLAELHEVPLACLLEQVDPLRRVDCARVPVRIASDAAVVLKVMQIPIGASHALPTCDILCRQ